MNMHNIIGICGIWVLDTLWEVGLRMDFLQNGARVMDEWWFDAGTWNRWNYHTRWPMIRWFPVSKTERHFEWFWKKISRSLIRSWRFQIWWKFQFSRIIYPIERHSNKKILLLPHSERLHFKKNPPNDHASPDHRNMLSNQPFQPHICHLSNRLLNPD